jgi:uncharacterized protein YbbC (DUF1343 family)
MRHSQRALFVALSLALGLCAQSGADLDRVINEAITTGQIPGAVAFVGQGDRILHYKAYGQRVLVPAPEPMTLDTIFDAASLTKVVSTASCYMKLVELGYVRLNDKVTVYLPEFQGGRSDITVKQLLTHYSGLRGDVDLEPAWSGYETGVRLALIDKPIAKPDEKFIYSDINYVLLGEIVRRLTGKSQHEYVQDILLRPLGMKDSGYLPPAAWQSRIAPTEHYPGDPGPLRGMVHDPTARYMGGVAGHAGLFSTASDLARFARMMLKEGDGLFSPAVVRAFTRVQSPANSPMLRGLGWEIDTQYNSTRGDLYPVGSFGHTGFTGTSLWMDPASDSYVVLMTNSVHPMRRPPIAALRSKLASIAAAMVSQPGAKSSSQVRTGLDVLAEQSFSAWKGRRVGLITNHTGITAQGERGLDVMRRAGVNLTALFSPEHGLYGAEDHENVGNTRDPASGIPVFSLYSGPTRAPTAAMLKNVDTLVFDIQDVGARFYTYGCTMANSMKMLQEAKLPVRFVVLDRPNPITGSRVEGAPIDRDLESFVGCMPIPLRHGMTMGEMARLLQQQRYPDVQLEVIAMQGWRRAMWFDETGLPWVNPSPNMRSLNAALLYPGVAMIEFSRNYSVGRGTDAPFEMVGADWIDGVAWAKLLAARQLPGLRFLPITFTPNASNLKDLKCGGLRIQVIDREALDAVRLGIEMITTLRELYPGKIDLQASAKLIGSLKLSEGIKAGKQYAALLAEDQTARRDFLEQRGKVLLYP